MPARPSVSNDSTSARSRQMYQKKFGKRFKARALKKTTKRGAYKRQAKKNFMIRRSPFIETKSKTYEDLMVQYPHLIDHLQFTVRTTPHRYMNPEVFNIHQQGLGESQIIGNSIYAKYLNMKFDIRFPQNGFAVNGNNQVVPLVPQDYELIWGWIPNPLMATGQTSPSAPGMSLDDINTHINQRVDDYINQQKDRLRFIPKRASTLRIEGRRKIRPNLNRSSVAPPQTIDSITGADYVVGAIPNVHTQISWKLMRKLHLEQATNLVPDPNKPGTNFPGSFVNYHFLPFCVFVNWDYEDLPNGSQTLYMPEIAYNQILYYSDS